MFATFEVQLRTHCLSLGMEDGAAIPFDYGFVTLSTLCFRSAGVRLIVCVLPLFCFVLRFSVIIVQ